MSKGDEKEEARLSWEKLGFLAYHLHLELRLNDQGEYTMVKWSSYNIVRRNSFQLNELR